MNNEYTLMNAVYEHSGIHKTCQIFHLHFFQDVIIYPKTKVCSDKTPFSSIEHTFFLADVAMFITCQTRVTSYCLSLDKENPRKSIVTDFLGENMFNKAKTFLRKKLG